METRQQRLIRQILEDDGDRSDTSLKRQALSRADERYVPRTLTAHEWEAWYAVHGRPRQHRAAVVEERGFWRRLRRTVDRLLGASASGHDGHREAQL